MQTTWVALETNRMEANQINYSIIKLKASGLEKILKLNLK